MDPDQSTRAYFAPASGRQLLTKAECDVKVDLLGVRVAFRVGTPDRGYDARVRIPLPDLLRLAGEAALKSSQHEADKHKEPQP